jgi:hypothetical protein
LFTGPTLSEISYHGYNPVETLSFKLTGGKFLNATSPLGKFATNFAPKTLELTAKLFNYDGIVFKSLRNKGGTNLVFYKNVSVLKSGKKLSK